MGFWYSVLYLASLGILAHLIAGRLPTGWFSPRRFPCRCYPWEQEGRFWLRFGVRRYKEWLPDMARLVRFVRPVHIGRTADDAALTTLVQHSCVAETVHWVLTLLAPAVCLIWSSPYSLLLCAADIFVFNLPFIILQRYNRPKLVAVLRRRAGRARPAGGMQPLPTTGTAG